MYEVIADIDRWLAAGETGIALATVVETWGSAPRRAGSKMAFTAGGAAISGSVSGGCVEGAVIEAGEAVLATGRPQLLHFGVADETAWDVGLACGGTIDVLVERLDPAVYDTLRALLAAERPAVTATVIRGPEAWLGRKLVGEPGTELRGGIDPDVDAALLALASRMRRSGRHELANDVEIFVDVLRPPPSLVIVGGAHIAVTLARLAQLMGYRTTVVDPRRAFGSEARFPGVDRLIQAWPQAALTEGLLTAETAVVTLSHDPKIDDPGLRAALESPAFYIGALGSRRTHARRRERLAAAGFDDAHLGRIHAPVGLDIGAVEPEEIALAIMAEVVQARRQAQEDGADQPPA